jgi:FixH protein
MATVPSIAGRARLPWALVPVALLLSSALGVGAMAIVAVRDPHFATEPDYYQKAISWDRTQAQVAENQRLGYWVEAPAQLDFDERGQATLELKLNDRLGQPVSGARLTADAFANAYSGRIAHVVFEEASTGLYRAKLTVIHRGQWVIKIAGSTAGDHFTSEIRLNLVPGGKA